MTNGRDKRKDPRYSLPILIDAPSLSQHPLVPDNISHTGFRVELRHRPHIGEVVECVFVVDGALFQNCRATVRWVMDHEVLSTSCAVGLSVEVEDDKKEEFLVSLSGVFDFMEEEP
ncbi:MAG: hypothetical protein HOC91_01850 [Nitrospinaceae bacterium]|jgi:hypothetical protein|nr:hypothetical protein [Nitrospinaceae bacterium]MBT3435748.1 hypothetical protein [Nitrospinaceae bacterium]MBT3821459.1 hypothetical protein [Nitrospinaceae bacterium]MBT4092869.1 hypothetical protein [Nitrospinaceae bacterium]MBT4429237.1 hypothetical protein [Nitrospinaceae bacterium]